nr:hypothetical protein GCM10010200_050820 [Actinomadura rugatobispora]
MRIWSGFQISGSTHWSLSHGSSDSEMVVSPSRSPWGGIGGGGEDAGGGEDGQHPGSPAGPPPDGPQGGGAGEPSGPCGYCPGSGAVASPWSPRGALHRVQRGKAGVVSLPQLGHRIPRPSP